ncbi:MAG: hypothetical protein U5L04_01710 [Trueperaceae bacterium]|nr:hypothetical protein [Trueperaceae bacterium]
MTDIITAIRHELAVSLEGISWPATLEVYRGWVEDARFVVPSVSVVVGRPQRTPHITEERREDVDADTIAVYWRIETVEVPASLIFYTETKTTRRDIADVMDKWLHPGPADNVSEPPRGRKSIVLGEHHDAECELIHDSDVQDDDEGRGGGWWKLEYSLTCRAPKLRRQEYEKATWSANTELVDAL